MYAAMNAYNAYKKDGIMTASPIELIVMLYDELLKQYKISKMMIDENSMDKANSALKKAGDIVTELAKSLDLKLELGRDLLALYDFMLSHTIKANAEKSVSMIDDLIEITQELRQTWTEIKGKAGHMYTIVD